MIGLMPASLAALIELERPVQIAVVGEGQGVHAQLLGPLQQAGDFAGTVQQAVVAMAVQMGERLRHRKSSVRMSRTKEL